MPVNNDWKWLVINLTLFYWYMEPRVHILFSYLLYLLCFVLILRALLSLVVAVQQQPGYTTILIFLFLNKIKLSAILLLYKCIIRSIKV